MEGHKILVLGDERHLFRTISWVLEHKGYDVSLTPRPEAALALLIEQEFELIIAKLQMEDLQALDVLKRAKKLNPEIRIMVVSADGNAAFPLEAFQIEVNDYLLVPVRPKELLRRVGQCLEQMMAVKMARAVAVEKRVQINQELSSRIILMAHDIRSGLVSTEASLKLLKRGKYGTMDNRAVDKVQEIFNRIQNTNAVLDEFSHEMLSGPGPAGARRRKKAGRREQIKPVPQGSRSESPLVR